MRENIETLEKISTIKYILYGSVKLDECLFQHNLTLAKASLAILWCSIVIVYLFSLCVMCIHQVYSLLLLRNMILNDLFSFFLATS